jgi:hypothetical protein
MTIRIEVPLTLPSVANMRLHWAKKAQLVKAQRTTVAWCLKRVRDVLTPPPNVVTLIRVAPRKLDDDNLASAFKAVRDQVAECIGVDDGDPRVTWRYGQLKGKAMVFIDLEVLDQPRVRDLDWHLEPDEVLP